MLKCPHCGARVKGPDLISGVCSSCQQRLSTSIDSSQAGFVKPDKTVSSEEASAPVGSSLEQPSSDAGSDVQAPIQTVLSDTFGHGFDVVAPPVEGRRDHDTGEAELASRAPSDDLARTFASEVVAPDDGTVQSDELAADSLAADAGDAGRTLVSELIDGVDPEASLKTLGSDDAEAAMKTIGMDGIAAEESADKTFVSEEITASAENTKTLVSESLGSVVGGDDKTFVSDDVPEEIIRTVQSEWGDAQGGRPRATLKGKDRDKPKGNKSTLVIKTKALRDIKVTPSPARDLEAEYELLKVLGEGGMGVVYDARQTSIDRSVALKMIKGSAAESEKQQAKFLAEAVVTGDLDHPNIVPIYDVGRNDEGALFYSMKKVVGTPWDKVIEKNSLAENVEILMKVADAVAFAHARGVIHRDLKPENTMLGEFGEVLVMDWGLAQPSKTFRKSASITETSSMGGTPAYMAPEMATGPLEKISQASDIYLLGAILYEIITGKPPHSGKNAMKCLMAAARNEITPTEKTGELLNIALKAMAAKPADRYPDVRTMQHAIREYQSHTESISLSTRAEADLVEAKTSDDYQQYSHALFGFQEAYELWDGNDRARDGIGRAQLAYAESARRKGDYDLGLSLLNDQDAEQQLLRRRLLTDKQEREARKNRILVLKRMLVAAAVVGLIGAAGFTYWINLERTRAVVARDDAVKAEVIAREEKGKADVARDDAVAAEGVARSEKAAADVAREAAEKSRQAAVAAEGIARSEKQAADVARDDAVKAKEKEEYEAYIAQIGLAAAKINENAFDTALELLNHCKPELRNWEWGRLMHLCSQSSYEFDAQAPLDALAVSADGKLFATGGWDATARLWNRETKKEVQVFKHGGVNVHAVAFSSDGRWLATGGDDPEGFAQIWDAATGKRVKTFTGHDDAVLSVAFSRDGRRLLTASYDKTARLWDVSTGKEIKAFRGHTWWVWQAVFSPKDDRIVTVSQDGTALVWDVDGDRPSPPFTGHHGPVYCAAFSPDGGTVVTGGYDRRLLVWKLEDLQPFNFRNLERGADIALPARFREFSGHATSVRSVNFSADGALLLSGGQDNTVRLWDYATGSILQTFRGHSGWVRQCVFVPDGRTLLSASHDDHVREWSIAEYEELRSLQGRRLAGHADAVLAAAYSPDQASVVTASRDRTARVWNARTGAEQMVLEEGHSFLASTARFFDGGRKLLTSAVDNTARVWDVATGTQLQRFDRTGRAAAAAVSPDERWLLTGGADKQAQLWDLSTGQRVKEFVGHNSEVTAVAFSADSTQVLTGDAKGHVILWNRETAARIQRFDGHSGRISAVAVAHSGNRVITASADKTVSQWDIGAGKEVPGATLKHPDGVLTMDLTADGRRAVTSCGDQRVRVWNLEANRVEHTIGPFPGLVYSLDVSDDGDRLLTAHAEERVVRLWDLTTGKQLAPGELAGAKSPSSGPLAPLIDLARLGGQLWAVAFAPGDDVLTVGGSDARLWDLKHGKEKMSFSPHGAVASARFSPDNQWVITGSWDNSAKIWDVKTGKAIVKLEGGHESFVNSATFSPDGRYALTAGDDGRVVLWDVKLSNPEGAATANIVRSIAAHDDRVRFAAFSKNGQWIVTASSDKTAKLWNAATGELKRTFEGHIWGVLSADFSKDGTRLVTGSDDNSAKIWNVATGECLRTLAGHTAPVASVAFAPDGARVLTGSQDQAAKLWDANTGKEVLSLNRHTEDVTSVAFSPDGKQVLTASRDGTAVIWLASDWKDVPAAVTLKEPRTK